ncbi:MAG TPA: DUF421 domain-containing protein [Ruminococcaceae bacterium]|jgi:uncharacterized membrane protein YcaP (DUF421 family)|nr:DUF421 domain-containing protein [Oscillospiraceae bacterium]
MGEIFKVILTSLGSVIALFILTRIIGNHQMSQLSMFDYVNGITIGSIAAEMATALEEFSKPLTAMIVYAIMSVLFSLVSRKSLTLRRVLEGGTLILYDDGKLFRKNLSKAKMDVSEFLTECRSKGYFNLANIQTAILEPNGKISILPVSLQRPLTPQDMNLSPEQDKLTVNVILDGRILHYNLKYTGNDQIWLQKQLAAQGITDIANVFLATCDNKNSLSVYPKVNRAATQDIFE